MNKSYIVRKVIQSPTARRLLRSLLKNRRVRHILVRAVQRQLIRRLGGR